MAESSGARLFRYDRRIATNIFRTTFSAWHDRLIAVAMFLMALAAARAWFSARAFTGAAWTASGGSIVVGLTVARMIAKRLAYHASDGPLAADALAAGCRRSYIVVCHIIGVAVLAALTLVVRASLLTGSLPGYLVGALFGHASASIALPPLGSGGVRIGWTIGSWLQRPRAGVIGAMILLLSLLLSSRAFGHDALVAIVSVETLGLALALTVVDDSLVRFMTIAGYGSWTIAARQARGAMLFLALAAPVCFLAYGILIGGIVVIVSIAALLLMALRILAYRLHAKRSADLLVSVLVAIFVISAVSVPFALPFLVAAMVWQLQRRASARSWTLA